MGTQVIKSFGVPQQFGVMVAGNHHQIDHIRTEALKNGEAQVVGDNLRFNVTAQDMEGKDYTGNDPRVTKDGSGEPGGTAFYKPDEDRGEAPIVEYEYGYLDKNGNEVLCSNSTHRDDIWSLNSYKDSGGFTPNLKLDAPAGSGVFKAFIRAYVRPEFNGGVGVKGPNAFWAVD